MGIILDIVLLAIFALSVFVGYKKGLIGVVFNLCAFLVSLVLTWILFTPVSNMIIKNTQIDDNIKNVIIEKGVIVVENNDKENEDEDNQINKYIQEYVSKPIKNTANNAVEETATIISQKVVAIGVAIGLFIVIRIVLIFLKFIAEGIANLPIIKQCNKAGGTLYGVIRGLFIVYIVLAILFFIMSINNAGVIADTINSSIISKYLYTHNIILDLIF
ncbi:MAG: CvpA family protein [Clostridia bacterium]|nr:CvpA family protein [Clostridia bacterium]